jgi:hypothetical protein
MASTLNKLTGMGGDVRKIAALLQKKAPPGHRLAYINEEEAALLKSRGGSGKPHADTGIPSYQDETDIGFGPGQYQPSDTGVSQQTSSPTNEQILSDIRYTPQSTTGYTGGGIKAQPGLPDIPKEGLNFRSLAYRGEPIYTPTPSAPTPAAVSTTPAKEIDIGFGAGQFQPKEEGLADQLAKGTGLSKDSLGKLGLAGLTGLLGSRAAGRAAETGQAGAQEMKALAAPYQQQGAQLQAQAQRGELTPVGQQSLKALQAQAAQGVEKRGGVGVMQAQQQVEAFRQQLLAQQYDYGLKLSGIGDNIALGAIRTGLQADQYVNQLTNQYYTNIARTAFGSAPQVAGTPATT